MRERNVKRLIWHSASVMIKLLIKDTKIAIEMTHLISVNVIIISMRWACAEGEYSRRDDSKNEL